MGCIGQQVLAAHNPRKKEEKDLQGMGTRKPQQRVTWSVWDEVRSDSIEVNPKVAAVCGK